MPMDLVIEIFISLALVIGGAFGLIGSLGLVKLPDPMTRLHGPSNTATLGVGAVLIASMAWFWGIQGEFSWHEILITIFVAVTAPVTSLFIAKANMHRNLTPADLPDPGRGEDWATFGESGAQDVTGGPPRDDRGGE
ncbi:Na+/H+ antiporter subunit G [Paracoccus pacificus]|uniref:Na+/H+ antiporter subunit G n=1 Tax=Paracoccus pacificus TaxID=1463598 RepID=A0ABW4R8N8_9RHOB